MRVLPPRADPWYCVRCGRAMDRTVEPDGFSAYAGEPLYRLQSVCYAGSALRRSLNWPHFRRPKVPNLRAEDIGVEVA